VWFGPCRFLSWHPPGGKGRRQIFYDLCDLKDAGVVTWKQSKGPSRYQSPGLNSAIPCTQNRPRTEHEQTGSSFLDLLSRYKGQTKTIEETLTAIVSTRKRGAITDSVRLAILFRKAPVFKAPMIIEELTDTGMLARAPQSIVSIPERVLPWLEERVTG